MNAKRLWWILPGAVLLIGVAVLLTYVLTLRSINPELRNLGNNATTISLDPPDDLNFAGEPVPLRDLEVRERLEQELIKNVYLHSVTTMNIKRAARWKAEMTAILSKQGVPADFFYLCVAESHLTNATSPMGAKGFWQFIENTGSNYDLEISEQVDERLDPIKSTYAAARYVKDSYKVFGNWTLVAASYNMGIGGLQGQLKRQQVSNYYDLFLNRETAAYVFRVLAIKSILENPEKYGFTLRPDQLYKPLRYRIVKVDQTIPDLIAFALEQGTTFKMLRVMNPWLLGDQLVVGKGDKKRIYEIKIPLDDEVPAGLGELMPRKPGEGRYPDSLLETPAPGMDTLHRDSGNNHKTTPKGKTGKHG